MGRQSKSTLLILIITFALMVPEAYAMNGWLKNYLQGMDQLLMVFWKMIYYWTWLVIPKFILCNYFYDVGKDIYDKAKLLEDDASVKIYKSECKKGVDRYF